MNTTTTPVRRFSAVAPLLILLLLAGLSIEEGLRLILTVDDAAQAGPAGWYVLLLGLILAATTIYTERPSVAPPPPDEDDDDTERPATPTRDMVVCLGVLALYAVLLGTAGYVLAGVVAVFVFLRAISRYGWPRSVLYTLAINAVFVALFELSGVVLPTGLLEF